MRPRRSIAKEIEKLTRKNRPPVILVSPQIARWSEADYGFADA